MTTRSPVRDLRRFLIEDVEEIESAVSRYHAGQLGAYQTVAVQLRNLLTDTSRSGPLLQRVIPDATLEALQPPMSETYSRETTGPDSDIVSIWVFDARGALTISGGNPPRLTLIVDTTRLVSPEQWANDWIWQPAIRIRDLVHEVGSKDAAHTDQAAGPTMSALEAALLYSHDGVQIPMARPVIVGIGEYIARRIRALLSATAPGESLGG